MDPVTLEYAWHTFDAAIESVPWGRNVYAVLRLDAALADAARAARTRRIEGTIDEVQVNVGINRADVIPDAFAYVGKALQRRVGAEPGDVVRCFLRPADPDDVPVPDDLREALARAGRLTTFDAKRPAERRRLLQPVEDAVQPETRRRRIVALVRSLGSD